MSREHVLDVQLRSSVVRAARSRRLALARNVAGRQEALELARQAYLPDFSLSASFAANASGSPVSCVIG